MILIPIVIVLGIFVITHLAISITIKDYTPEEQEEIWRNIFNGFNNYKQ